ncbi:myelin regulatory factor-like protein [Harmonia axyridis]|uniref:myelin regulatory factor-like protein n=1 Tax=Harmonia axyridis TaxID=115357 RepID=UPI001E2775FC|nr:myelin regulatory factor-like protein [Harmonia axyridis]
MDNIVTDWAIQAILGRGTDFVGGIDNEALDFSQLADFINNDGASTNSPYFGDTLNGASSTEKLLNVIVENKRNASGHSLPESPPDSSSEHPYSPQDGNEPNLSSADNIYTTIGQNMYKPAILNPIMAENLILGSHIVVTEQNGDQQIIENGNLLQDTTMLVNNDMRSGDLLSNRLMPENMANEQNIMENRLIIPSDGNLGDNRSIILTGEQQNAQHFEERIYNKVQQDFDKNYVICECNTLDLNLPRNGMCEQNVEGMKTVYTNLQNAPKKRKLSQDVVSPKVEPGIGAEQPSQMSPSENMSSSIGDDDYQSSEACLSESGYQCIRFNSFLQNNWHTLCDQNLTELPVPHYRVDADKGFNFSTADDAFVCQKKNHFQITCHVQVIGDAQFVKTSEGFQKISSFHLHFYGVKHDCPTQTIRVEQSQSDRSKKPFHPVLIELLGSQVTKVTVGRLHFSETTSNNMRKKGKPNPEQRYFQLVVGLHAHTASGNYPIVSHASQKIIVRASNPGQFENDVELCWQKGQTQDSICHNGKVGIGTDRPDESLVVHGNIKVTGHIIQPSDIRAKKNIVECDTATQLKNVQKIRVVRYEYDPNFAAQLNKEIDCFDTGVIAQEVAEIIPEAVSPAGNLILKNGNSIDNFLVVNKERIFMENIGAVKELCKVTDNLGNRIDQLERINKRLNKIKRGDSLKSTSTISSGKASIMKKCPKHHQKCPHDDSDELCSNKFIQIVIVILVLIMAFCLAAITTLYLMETSRYQHFAQSLENSHRTHSMKRPTKSTKSHTWLSFTPYIMTTDRNSAVNRLIIDKNLLKKPYTIGKPSDCLNVDQDLENSNLCQIYCCADIKSSIFDKTPLQRNRTDLLLNLEKNGVNKPLHSNDIEKQITRHKRNSLDLSDESNVFDTTDDQLFVITVQGRNFNTTLTDRYFDSVGNYNYTYVIPLSKYMPDEYLNLIFRFNQPNVKEIEHCFNDFKRNECPYSGFFDDKTETKHRINENNSEHHINSHSIVFEVAVMDFQSKMMTYRAPLQQSQNICRATKLGFEFVEYNFLFHRQCDE